MWHSVASSNKNAEKLKVILKDNPHIMNPYFQHTLNIGSAANIKVVTSRFKVGKLYSWWVPHEPTDEQKQVKIAWFQELLVKFHSSNSKRLYEVVIWDDIRINIFYAKTERQDAVWAF